MLGQLGDYRIVREIGRGGTGIVYESLHQRPARSLDWSSGSGEAFFR